MPAFVALAAAQVVLSRGGDRRWLTYSLLSATAYLGCFVLASAGFNQASGLVEVGGLFQRLTVIIGWGWTVALALRLLRRS